MQRQFCKMHGLGNDFVVFDATQTPLDLRAAQVHRITDRRYGIGCDQILILDPPPVPEVDFGYRIINSDGSLSGQCGNGARCMSLFVARTGLSDKNPITVRTTDGDMILERLDNEQVRVNMGIPKLDPGQIPFRIEERDKEYTVTLESYSVLSFGVVNMGNPHAVIQVEDCDAAQVDRIGVLLQQSEYFPESVNVGFMQILNPHHIHLRVYERGAGETLACGSGACAAVVVGRDQGHLEQEVTVTLPGGDLLIEWASEEQPVYMTGPATLVYTGSIEL